MSNETEQAFGLGEYWTVEGYRAIVDAVVDGYLVGRVNISLDKDATPLWQGVCWKTEGVQRFGGCYELIRQRPPVVRQHYWLNVYQSGPGLLRNTWEESLIEASRSDDEVLCRVPVDINAKIGEGLR